MILPFQAIELLERASRMIAECSTKDRARVFITEEVTKALHSRLERIGDQLTQEAETLIRDLLRRQSIQVPQVIYDRQTAISPPEIHTLEAKTNAKAVPCKPGEY